jgi:hypothetical protein
VSEVKPWTDAKKWWMGIVSALVIASALAFTKGALQPDPPAVRPDPPAVRPSLTGTYCGSYDNDGITEVLELSQEGSVIKGTAYFADGRGNRLAQSSVQGAVASDGSVTIVIMRKEGDERYTGVGKADAISGTIQLSGIGPNNYYTRPCPAHI